MVTGSSDSTVKILDLLEGRLMYTLHGHKVTVVLIFTDDTRQRNIFGTDLILVGFSSCSVLCFRVLYSQLPFPGVEISLPREELTLRFVPSLSFGLNATGDNKNFESIKNSFNFSVFTVTFCLVNTGADVEDKL